jgi:hypothetical protein
MQAIFPSKGDSPVIGDRGANLINNKVTTMKFILILVWIAFYACSGTLLNDQELLGPVGFSMHGLVFGYVLAYLA